MLILPNWHCCYFLLTMEDSCHSESKRLALFLFCQLTKLASTQDPCAVPFALNNLFHTSLCMPGPLCHSDLTWAMFRSLRPSLTTETCYPTAASLHSLCTDLMLFEIIFFLYLIIFFSLPEDFAFTKWGL